MPFFDTQEEALRRFNEAKKRLGSSDEEFDRFIRSGQKSNIRRDSKQEQSRDVRAKESRGKISRASVLSLGLQASRGIVKGVNVPMENAEALRNIVLTQQIRTNGWRR